MHVLSEKQLCEIHVGGVLMEKGVVVVNDSVVPDVE